MAEATFDDLFKWLQEHAGKSVYLEVGIDDPDSEVKADAFPVAIHVELGEVVEPAHDVDQDRMVAMVRLPQLERSRLYFDPTRITRVQTHIGTVKVWFHDIFYVALSGS